MRFSVEALKKPAVAVATLVALGGCASSSPDVPAQLQEEVNVRLDNKEVALGIGTEVVATCRVNPSELAVEIKSGRYEGEDTTIPRAALEATEDPYGAGQETPPRDPFSPLPPC